MVIFQTDFTIFTSSCHYIQVMRKIYQLIILTILSLNVHAQDPHFSQFFSSPLTLNPAFTGKFDGSWRLAANHRDQWPSIPKVERNIQRKAWEFMG
jgi:hypothetical protein